MVLSWIANRICRLRADERGTVSIIMGILMVPLVGALALGFEISNWSMVTRNMQNAADAAALAAAINGGSNYDVEAKAVAATYGFVNGTNNVTVAVSNAAACPGGGNTCYSATISGFVPLLLSQVVGFKGDTNLNGTLEKKLSSAAFAKPSTQPDNLCMLALASSGAAQGIRSNGAPSANMNGCDVMSNTAAQCNGSNLGAGLGLAAGTSNGCGAKQISNVPKVTDPYASLAKDNIPANPCGSSPPQEPVKKADPPLPSSNLLSGFKSLSGNNILCGDIQLTANVTIDAPTGAVLVIENGQLDLNGFSLKTTSGSGLTVVFSGDDSGSYTHAPTDNSSGGKGALDLAAPTSGPWSGVAIYQDPSLKSGLDVSEAGNSPTWNITGLVYMPHASVTLKGAIDKATSGHQCLVLVADNFTISGTGGILKTDIGECPQAGLTMPAAKIPGRSVLVL